MKKAIRISVSLLVVVMAFSSFCFGQDTRLSKTKEFTFNNESEKVEIKIKVTKEYNKFSIGLNGKLMDGEIKYEIIDPKNKVQGNFTLKTEKNVTKGKNTSLKSSTSGNMQKYFRNPIVGTWIIRIHPKKASGKGNVIFTLEYDPIADLSK